MKIKEIKIAFGYILTGISFLFLISLTTGTHGIAHNHIAVVTGVAFFLGILLKKDGRIEWKRNLKAASLITAFTAFGDWLLQWFIINEISVNAFLRAGNTVLGHVPVLILIWVSILFYQKKKEPVSFLYACLAEIGDSLPVFLIAGIVVSSLPLYWNYSNHPLIFHLFYDCLLTMMVMIMLDTDGIQHNGIIAEYQESGIYKRLSSFLSLLNKKTKKLQTVLFYLSFAYLFFHYFFITTTMFPTAMKQNYNWILTKMDTISVLLLLVIHLLAIFAMYDADQKYERVWIRTALIFGFVFFGQSWFGAIFSFLMLLCAGVKKDAGKIIKIAFGIALALMLFAWFCASKGIITDVVVDNHHGLGIIYSTDCFAHWFYLFAMYCLIRKEKFRWFEYPITLVLILYIYRLTGAETNLVCLGLLWLTMLVRQYLLPHMKKHEFHLSKVLVYSYWFFAALYFIAVKCIDQLTPFLQAHFYTLWQRLYYGKTGLSNYQIRFLFQHIAEHGNGLNDYVNHTFFYLDVSYIRILLMYGILTFAFIMILMTWFLHHARKEKAGLLFAILVIIALQSLVEQRLPEFWYNIFLILPLTDLQSISCGNQKEPPVKVSEESVK